MINICRIQQTPAGDVGSMPARQLPSVDARLLSSAAISQSDVCFTAELGMCRSRQDARPGAFGPGSNVAAHDGAVTALLPTLDGLFWLTAGTDSRVRQWDSLHHRCGSCVEQRAHSSVVSIFEDC